MSEENTGMTFYPPAKVSVLVQNVTAAIAQANLFHQMLDDVDVLANKWDGCGWESRATELRALLDKYKESD